MVDLLPKLLIVADAYQADQLKSNCENSLRGITTFRRMKEAEDQDKDEDRKVLS